MTIINEAAIMTGSVSAGTGFDATEPSQGPQNDTLDLHKNKILIVDDNPINLIALES